MNTNTEINDRDNKNDRKPDPPGEELLVHSYINTHFDSFGTMSAMTDPPLINFHNQDPPSNAEFTQHVSVPSMSYSMNSTNTDIPHNKSSISSSKYWLNNSPNRNSSDDNLLLLMTYPLHSNMMNYVKHYAAVKGFIPLHCVKVFFEPHISSTFFPDKNNHSLEPIDKKTTKLPR
jgi:hypothetical protein